MHPQYTAGSFEHCCQILLQVGAVMITDPLVPLAIDPGSFALVPLKPLRMVAEFKACLREEARLIEKRVALVLGNSSAAARTVMRRRKSRK